MARYSRRRVTWRDKPLFNQSIPFIDDYSGKSRVHKVKEEVQKTPVVPGKRPRPPPSNNSLPPSKKGKSWGQRHPYEKDALIGLGMIGGLIASIVAPEGALGAIAAEEIEMTPLLRGKAVTGIKKTYGSIKKAARVFKKFRRSEKIAWKAARNVYKLL